MTSAGFDPEAVLRALDRHGVEYVVIGGVAAAALGSPSHSDDLDICHDPDPDNVARLETALAEVGARSVTWNVVGRASVETDAGRVDCIAQPYGTRGFVELCRTADEVEIDDLHVRVASIDDLMLMKIAAGRLQDRVHLENLGALRDELEGR